MFSLQFSLKLPGILPSKNGYFSFHVQTNWTKVSYPRQSCQAPGLLWKLQLLFSSSSSPSFISMSAVGSNTRRGKAIQYAVMRPQRISTLASTPSCVSSPHLPSYQHQVDIIVELFSFALHYKPTAQVFLQLLTILT